MSNLQDGGLVIIGRPEDPHIEEGLSASDLATFDPDVMRDQFDAYASPRAIVSMARIEINGYTYAVIDVSEFEGIPVICKKDLQGALRAGAVYVRPFSGRPRTVAVASAEEMRPVIQLAVDKGIMGFAEQARRRGFARMPNDAASFDAELGDIR